MFGRLKNGFKKPRNRATPPDPAIDTPAGIPASYQEHIQIMFDMLLLAFQTDSTRIATLLLAHDGSNRTFPDLGFPEGHHNLSHHHNDKSMIEKIAQIDQFYMQRLADFLQKLEDTKDLDGHSLLVQLDDRVWLRQRRWELRTRTSICRLCLLEQGAGR